MDFLVDSFYCPCLCPVAINISCPQGPSAECGRDWSWFLLQSRIGHLTCIYKTIGHPHRFQLNRRRLDSLNAPRSTNSPSYWCFCRGILYKTFIFASPALPHVHAFISHSLCRRSCCNPHTTGKQMNLRPCPPMFLLSVLIHCNFIKCQSLS